MNPRADRVNCPRCRRSRSIRPSSRDLSLFRCLRCNHAFRAPDAVAVETARPTPLPPIDPLLVAYADDALPAPIDPLLVAHADDALPAPVATVTVATRDATRLTNALARAALIAAQLALCACWVPRLAVLRLVLAVLGLACGGTALGLALARRGPRAAPTLAVAVAVLAALVSAWITRRG